ISGGIKCRKVPQITAKLVANHQDLWQIDQEWQIKLDSIRQKLNILSGDNLQAWEVPARADDNWSDLVKTLWQAWWQGKQQRRTEINKAIAKHANPVTLFDQPLVDRKKLRVAGPFTVEAVPAPVVRSLSSATKSTQAADSSIARRGETHRQAWLRDELFNTGIRGKSAQKIKFSRVEILAGTSWLHAEAETEENDPQRAVIVFGPEYAPLASWQLALAIAEAKQLVPRPQLVIFVAFQFEPEAARTIDEMVLPDFTLLKVQINTDLLTSDLKKGRSGNDSFWLIGQPDITLRRSNCAEQISRYQVEVHGFDYYNPHLGKVESGDKNKIAMWLLDTDYDGCSLLPSQVFFPMSGRRDGWERLARALSTEINAELLETYRGTTSLPFEPGQHKRLAVKIIDDRGIESLRVMAIG
ncbi:MAG: site-specific DNA-methyltransferase, partial [Cyanobacteria bacterium NC_groundwater_1444_Ag_S-0.65um_54_12]|nr:site-specific DNA-methyltransferase [Cyanobacteria bacterium NC_groundwater_1444_Ag_S-0.65um_54_12]